MDLSENLRPLAPLITVWKGDGAGEYPTIDSFEYSEELTFTDIGKPFLLYLQRTWSPRGAPMHTETGYVRMPAPGAIEMTLAQPTGQTELLEGTWEPTDAGFAIRLKGRILNSSTAKTVEATTREYHYSAAGAGAAGGALTTTFAMAAVGEPMTHHLASRLAVARP